jgi:sterol desaturase/sphingolipid hydroxylase (fatty acid hydroxylase superfamily)
MGILARLQHHLIVLTVDILRLCVWLVLLIFIFAPLERIFAVHGQKFFRKAFFTDLGWYFLGGILPSPLLIPSMAAIAWALHSVVPAGLHARVAAMPLGMRLGVAVLVGEIGFYWGHRWSHQIPFLWRFHAIHHSAEEMDWLVSTRAHPVDLVFTRLCGFVPLYVLGLAQPMANKLDIVPLLVIIAGIAWGFFIHANLNWRFGPLEWLVSTPAFHHWHHTYNEPLNKNFSPMLPWVDRLFGTYYAPKAQWPSRYGTETPVPSGLAGQLLDPLSALRSETGLQAEPAAQSIVPSSL